MRTLDLLKTTILPLALTTSACGDDSSKNSPDTSTTDTSTTDTSNESVDAAPEDSSDSTTPAPLPVEPFAASGTRLRAVFAKVDGLSLFNGFWDEELQTRCQFSPADNANLRCLPEAAFLPYFADANCTEIWLNRRDSCGNEPKYFTNAIQEDLCSEVVTEVWSVTPSEAPPPSGPLYRRDPTGCYPVAPDESLPTQLWYRPETKLELDSFVSATRGYGSAGGEPGVSILQGSDGSRVVENLALPSGEICVPRRASPSNESRCIPFSDVTLELPTRIGSYAWFGDSECKNLLAYAPSQGRTCAGAELPKYATVVDFDPAPAPPRPFVGLTTVTGILRPEAPVWQRLTEGGPCVQTVASASIFELYTVGDPIPVESFPLMGATTIGDQVTVDVPVDSAGHPLSGGIFYQTMYLTLGSGGSCLTYSTEDGLVCVGTDTQFVPPFGQGSTFSDDACKRPLLESAKPGDVLYVQAENTCQELTQAWKVGQALEFNLVFTMNAGECAAMALSEPMPYFPLEATEIEGIPVTLETSPAMP